MLKVMSTKVAYPNEPPKPFDAGRQTMTEAEARLLIQQANELARTYTDWMEVIQKLEEALDACHRASMEEHNRPQEPHPQLETMEDRIRREFMG